MIFDSLFYLPLFIFAIFVAFYIPGKVIVGKNLESFTGQFEKIIVSLVVGLVLWGYQGAVFGYLGMRFLSYVYLALFSILWIRQRTVSKLFSQIRRNLNFKGIKINWTLLIIFAVGIFGQTQQFLITGLELSDGIHVFTGASDDALFHTSLIAQIIRRFPPFEPGLVNVVVYNYHYWSNLVIAELIRVFHLPLLSTQFQYSYILISFLLGGVAYVLAKILKFSSIGLAIFVYLQYFSSDIIYVLTIFTRRFMEFRVHPLEDGTMFLENPPRAFAAIVLLGGVIFLIDWIRNKTFRSGVLACLLFASLIGFKVHTGISALAGLGVLSFYFLLKREWKLLIMPFITLVISTLIYFPVNKDSGMLVFIPFEMTRMFVVQPNLYLSNLELARRIYSDHNNILQQWRMDLTMLVIFLIGQFGLRIIGFMSPMRTIRQLGIPLSIFIYSGIITAIILGTFFYQPVAGPDIFNFYLAGSLLLSIPTSLIISKLIERKLLFIQICILSILIFMSIPRWIYKTQTVKGYFDFHKSSPAIHRSELDAMEFIRKNTSSNDIVLVFNHGQWDSLFPYVGAFTQRDMYLSGQGILGRHGIPFEDRAKIVRRILTSENRDEVKSLLKHNDIRILYFYGRPLLEKGLADLQLKKIYQSDSNTIYYFK